MNVEELNKAMINAAPSNKSSITTDIPPDNSLGDYLNDISTRHVNNLTYLKPKENKYGKYNVFINPINSEKELQQERARNQSGFEQAWHAAGQMVANELVIGTVLGLSNLVDFFANIGNEKGDDDYTNPVSTWLEGLQDSVRDSLAIYQENPGEAFDIFDSGWWFNNSVSIASSLSMLIPAAGTLKAVSGIGKLAKLTKAGKAIDRLGRSALIKTAKTYKTITRTEKSAGRIANAIKVGRKQIATAALSRTMENYMEGREVYKEVYENSLDKVNNMTSEQRKELIHNNPQFEGKSDEEIAKYMASVSADYTFGMDYAMMIFDLLQLRGISALWRPAANKTASAALRLEQKNAIRAMSGLAGEAGEKAGKQVATKGIKGWGNRQLERLKHPLSTLAGVEWSEGFEEGYQGIMTERGKEVAEMMLDNNFSRRSIFSYLKDSAIWEQAFWGVAGGVAFQGAGTYFGNLSNKIKTKINKKDISKEDYALGLTADEKYRAAEIRSRFDKTKAYQAEMERLNGDNPVKIETTVNEKGEVVNKEIPMTAEEIEAAKVKATNDYITDMVFHAVDAGNFDLLSEYLKDPTITAALKKVGADVNTMFENEINNYMQTTRNEYEDNIYKVGNEAKDDTSESVIRLAARELTRRKIEIDSLQNQSDSVNDEINRLTKDDYSGLVQSLIDKYEKVRIKNYINETLANLARARKIVRINKDKKLSKQAQDAYFEDYNEVESTIEQLIKDNPDLAFDFDNFKIKIDELLEEEGLDIYSDKKYTDAVNKILKDLNDETFDERQLDAGLKKLVNKKVGYATAISQRKAQMPVSHDDYTKLIDHFTNNIEMFNGIKVINAAEKVEEYIIKQENLDEAIQNVIDGNVPEELKESLDILKWGYSDSDSLVKSILLSAEEERNKRAKIKRDSKQVNINGQTVKDETVVEEEKRKAAEHPVGYKEDKKEDKKEDDDNASHPVEGEDTSQPADIPFVDTTDDTSDNTTDNTDFDGVAPEDKQAPQQPIVDTTGVETQVEDESNETLAYGIDMSGYDNVDFENDELTSKLYRTLIKELYKASLQGTIILDDLNANANALESILERIRAAAINYGFDPNIVNISLKSAKSLIFSTFKYINKSDSINSYIAKIINAKASATTDIDTKSKAVKDAIANFLYEYCRQNGIFEINGTCKINLENLFDYLLDQHYSIDQVGLIFDDIKSIIGADDRFVIWSVYDINTIMSDRFELRKSITTMKTRKEEAKTQFHISLTNDKAEGVDLRQNAINALLSSKKNPKITYKKASDNSIDFFIKDKNGNSIKIGYVVTATRKADEKNGVITYTPNYSTNSNKVNLIKTVSRELNPNGTFSYVASSDDLVNAILDDTRLFNIAINRYINKKESLTEEDINKFIEILKEKNINFSGIFYNENSYSSINEIVTPLLDSLNKIIFFKNNNLDITTARINYATHKSQVFYNYDFTNRLMDSLVNKTNKKFDILLSKVTAKAGGDISKLKINDEESNVGDLKFNSTDNPIIGALPTQDGIKVICEDRTIPTDGMGNLLPVGIMGFYIGERAGFKGIARITSSNHIGGEILTNLQAELHRLFDTLEKEASNPKTKNKAVDKIYTALSELFNSNLTMNPTIFKGIQIINTTNDKSNTRFVNVRCNNEQLITIVQNLKTGDIRIEYGYGSKDNAISTICNNTSYNTSFITLKSNANNSYFSVDDKGFHVTLNGKTLTYSNFADFAIKNRAFNTRQGISEKGSYFEDPDEVSSIFLTVKDKEDSAKSNINHVTPVSSEQKRNDNTNDETVTAEEESKRNNIVFDFVKNVVNSIPVYTNKHVNKLATIRKFIDILKDKDYIKEYLDFYKIQDKNTRDYIIKTISELYENLDNLITNLNKVNLTSGIYITSDGFIDELNKAQAAVNLYNTSNIIFLNSGEWYAHINPELSSGNFNAKLFNELKRLLIHESLHLKYEKATEESKAKFKGEIEAIIAKFEEWCNDNPNDKIAIWYNTNKANMNINPESGYEEFVVEALSRPELANTLNNIDSGKDLSKKEPKKSIFKKIVDAILELLGININDNSLYHEMYLALSNIQLNGERLDNVTNNAKDTKKTNDTNDTNDTQKTNDEKLNEAPVVEENETPVETNDIYTEEENANNALKGGETKTDKNDEIDITKLNLSQTTDIIDDFTNRDIIITSMDEFINKFPLSERENIRQMLESNELKYYCK